MKHTLIVAYRSHSGDGNPNAWKEHPLGEVVVKDATSFEVLLDFFKKQTSFDIDTTYEDVEDAVLSGESFNIVAEDWMEAFEVQLTYCLDIEGLLFKLTPHKRTTD